MIAIDYAFAVRKAALPLLKDNAQVLALVPSERVYPSTTPAKPTFPFVRYGAPTQTPFRRSGLGSSSVAFKVHGFTRPLLSLSGGLRETAEDQAYKLGLAISTALDGRVAPIDGALHVTFAWTGSTVIQDGDEADAWHAVVSFTGDVAG